MRVVDMIGGSEEEAADGQEKVDCGVGGRTWRLPMGHRDRKQGYWAGEIVEEMDESNVRTGGRKGLWRWL
jgi:hypothetical protein